MSHHIFVRPARADDKEKFVTWSIQTKDNLLDPDVANYPSTFVLCAFDSNGPILYVPVQQPLFMDALAINPDASPALVAMALKEVTQALVTKSYYDGRGELYFLCADESTSKFAESQAFEKMPWNVYRIKLKNIESK